MNLATLLPRFDAFLAARSRRLDAVVTGGAALALLGIISRETRECDLLEPELSEELQEAARAFAADLRAQGETLRDDWLNTGPAALGRLLPDGWRGRLQLAFRGEVIELWCLGRSELLLAKLWALCDRGLDLGDCVALAPDPLELTQAEAWISVQDLHPDWPAHVHATLRALAERLGHGL